MEKRGNNGLENQTPDRPEPAAEVTAFFPGAAETVLPPPEKNRPLRLRLVALGLAFLVFLLSIPAGLYTILTRPSLGLLQESARLKQDPLIQELARAVVQVETSEAPAYGRGQRGTGFNISPEGLVITARHLLQEAAGVTVSFPHGKTYRAREWLEHPVLDLAVIKLETAGLPTVFLETQDPPRPGKELIIIGNPLGFTQVVMKGEVARYIKIDRESGLLMEITAPIYPGASGSPVFNSRGRVVAVVFAATAGAGRARRESRGGLAVPVGRLAAHLTWQEQGGSRPAGIPVPVENYL